MYHKTKLVKSVLNSTNWLFQDTEQNIHVDSSIDGVAKIGCGFEPSEEKVVKHELDIQKDEVIIPFIFVFLNKVKFEAIFFLCITWWQLRFLRHIPVLSRSGQRTCRKAQEKGFYFSNIFVALTETMCHGFVHVEAKSSWCAYAFWDKKCSRMKWGPTFTTPRLHSENLKDIAERLTVFLPYHNAKVFAYMGCFWTSEFSYDEPSVKWCNLQSLVS